MSFNHGFPSHIPDPVKPLDEEQKRKKINQISAIVIFIILAILAGVTFLHASKKPENNSVNFPCPTSFGGDFVLIAGEGEIPNHCGYENIHSGSRVLVEKRKNSDMSDFGASNPYGEEMLCTATEGRSDINACVIRMSDGVLIVYSGDYSLGSVGEILEEFLDEVL